MTKLTSKTIRVEDIDRLVKQLKNDPALEIDSVTNQYELFRGRIEGKVIIIYKSGKVSYHPSPVIEKILADYEDVKIVRKKETTRLAEDVLNVKLAEPQKNALIELLSNESDIQRTGSKNQHVQARFKKDKHVIEIYTTGSVYSPNGKSVFVSYVKDAILQKPTHPDFDLIIGQDEAGKGEIFGPMVVASVALNNEQIVDLQLEGVRDSKKLNESQISDLSTLIKEKSLGKRAVTIGAERFNELYSQMKDENKNLNDLLAWGHSKALEEVLKQLNEHFDLPSKKILVIIDEFNRIKTDERIRGLLRKYSNIEVLQRHQAEDLSISVAAASILARHVRNVKMAKLEKEIGIPLKLENLLKISLHDLRDKVIKRQFARTYLNRGQVINRNIIEGVQAEKHIEKIRKQMESHKLDFKKEFPRQTHDIVKLISAFANHEGGDIYFGIEDKTKEIVGVENVQKLEERISGVRKLCDPPPLLEFFIYHLPDGKTILKVHIEKSEELVGYDGAFYYRDKNSSVTRKLKRRELEELFKRT